MNITVIYSSATQKGIIKGLTNLGHSVIPMYYGMEYPTLLERFLYRQSEKRLKKIVSNFNVQLQKFEKSWEKDGIDLLLIMKGHFLTPESKAFLKGLRIPKIQWTIDSFERFPGQADVAQFMDKVFIQDGIDERNGFDGKWLPLGFDEEVFKYHGEKDIDVLLMGRVIQPYYKSRLEYLLKASELGNSYKVVFAGSHLQEPERKILESNNVTIHDALPFPDYAKVISRAKICVNIHQEDGGKPVNPMFFAIPATGGIQLTEQKDYLSHWLTPGKIYYPETLGSMNQRIVSLLTSGVSPLSQEVADEICNKHSYTARAIEILS